MSCTKTNDPSVLQKTPDDAFHANIVGKARNAGAQTADSAHDKLDAYSGLAGPVKTIDQSRINQRIQLEPDRSGTTRACVDNLLLDRVNETATEIDGRN